MRKMQIFAVAFTLFTVNCFPQDISLPINCKISSNDGFVQAIYKYFYGKGIISLNTGPISTKQMASFIQNLYKNNK